MRLVFVIGARTTSRPDNDCTYTRKLIKLFTKLGTSSIRLNTCAGIGSLRMSKVENAESGVDRLTGTICDETRPFDFSKARRARDADASRVPSPLESVENYPRQ